MLLPAAGGILGAAGSAAAGAGTAGAATGAGTLGLGAGAGLSTGTMAGTMLGAGVTGAGFAPVLGSTAALGANSLAALSGSTGGLPSNVPTGWENVSKEVGLGTPKATYIPPDVAKVIGSPSLLSQAKDALGVAKQAKGVYDAGMALFGGQPAQDGTGGLAGTPGFLDSEETFLNKIKPSANTAGLKTVNDEAQQNVESVFDDGSEDTQKYADAGLVEEKKSKGALEDQIKELNDIYCKNNFFCWKKLTEPPKFDRCDAPSFLYSTRQSTHSNPLKQLKQGLRVNPLASGGLPHKYAAAAPKGHKPEFITGMTGYYACGHGTGQSDDIPAMLHDGDYVMDAETVSALGDGSSKAGHKVLEGFREQIPHKKNGGGNPVPAKIADGEYVFPEAFVTALGGGDNKRGAEVLDGLRNKLRAHKRGAPLDKIPPKAKDPIEYIKTGSK